MLLFPSLDTVRTAVETRGVKGFGIVRLPHYSRLSKALNSAVTALFRNVHD